jgi:hypothetical protein
MSCALEDCETISRDGTFMNIMNLKVKSEKSEAEQKS